MHPKKVFGIIYSIIVAILLIFGLKYGAIALRDYINRPAPWELRSMRGRVAKDIYKRHGNSKEAERLMKQSIDYMDKEYK